MACPAAPLDGEFSSYLTTTVDSADVLLRTSENLYNEHNARYYGAVGMPLDLYPTLKHASETVEKGLVLIRRLLNKSCSIHRLPPELLIYIFSHVARDRFHKMNLVNWYLTSAVSSVPLLPITLVCTHWYEVVTSAPFLWSTIDTNHHKTLPLTSRLRPSQGPLYATVVDSIGEEGKKLLDSEGHRVHEFRLLRTVPVLGRWQTSFYADHLRFCQIETVDRGPYNGRFPIFNGRTPQLEALLISGMVILPANQFPSLTHLILDHYDVRQKDDDASWCRDFMEFLSRCPALQVLHLAYLENHQMSPDSFEPTSLVTLKHLSKLSIEGHNDDSYDFYEADHYDPTFLLALLKWLRFPIQTTLVRIYGVAAAEDFASVVELLKLCGDNRGLSCLSIGEPMYTPRNQNPKQCFSLQLVDPRSGSHGIRIDVSAVNEDGCGGTWDGMCCTVGQSDLYRDVERLWVSSATAVSDLLMEGDLNLLFSQLPPVTTIFLPLRKRIDDWHHTEDDKEQLAEYDAPRFIIDELGPMGIGSVPCPQLHTLCVQHLFALEQCQSIANVLKKRESHGCPVRRLIVSIPPTSDDEAAQLEEMMKRLVEDVIVVIESRGDTMPDDVLWERVVPAECYEQSRVHAFWPVWRP